MSLKNGIYRIHSEDGEWTVAAQDNVVKVFHREKHSQPHHADQAFAKWKIVAESGTDTYIITNVGDGKSIVVNDPNQALRTHDEGTSFAIRKSSNNGCYEIVTVSLVWNFGSPPAADGPAPLSLKPDPQHWRIDFESDL